MKIFRYLPYMWILLGAGIMVLGGLVFMRPDVKRGMVLIAIGGVCIGLGFSKTRLKK